MNDIFKKIKPVLGFAELDAYYSTGIHSISGGFSEAEYIGCGERYAFFFVKWGVVSDVENRVTYEYYRISIKDLFSNKAASKKYLLCSDNIDNI